VSRAPLRIFFFAAALAFSPPCRAAEPPPFAWKDGDRVVLVGDTLIERDQRYGYLETLITAQNPDKSITFRNLGWSGDTVRGLSRARFGPPAEGWQHLIDHVNALKPTVLIVGYGMAESFDGEAGLPAFASGLNALIDATSASKPRLILLSPIAHEDLGRPLPDPTNHNKDLSRYRDAIKTVADERKAWFVDLFNWTQEPAERLTDNGIHPTAFGHFCVGTIIFWMLEGHWNAFWDRDVVVRAGPEPTDHHRKFSVSDATLPVPPLPPGSPPDLAGKKFSISGLEPGRYRLSIEGRAITTADAEGWSGGVPIPPETDQVEALRAAINAKNALYFYRWRPQNETYLLGFRKHEQGNNAAEIPLFDPLVGAKEKEIARLRKPVTHVYELTRESEAAK